MTMDGNDLFRQAMLGIQPLDTETRASPPEQRSKTERPQLKKKVNLLPTHQTEFSGTGEPWVLKANGLSHDQLRRLSSGRMPPDFELDLHGKTRDEACQSLMDCFAMAAVKGWRVLSIIHGRGLHSSEGRSVLKKATYDWLRNGPCASMVLAAIPRRGSRGGACLVLLRRSRG